MPYAAKMLCTNQLMRPRERRTESPLPPAGLIERYSAALLAALARGCGGRISGDGHEREGCPHESIPLGSLGALDAAKLIINAHDCLSARTGRSRLRRGGLAVLLQRRAARTLDERDVRHGRHHKRQEERDDEGPHEGGRCSQSRCVCGQTERSRSSQLWSSISDDRRRNTAQDGISENLGKTIKTSATGTGQDRPQDTPDRCVCGEVSEGVR